MVAILPSAINLVSSEHVNNSVSPAVETDAALPEAAISAPDIFGPAVTVDLSDKANAIIAAQASAPDATPAVEQAGAPATPPPASDNITNATPQPPAGGGKTTTDSEITDNVQSALRKVAAQVGMIAATELVDKKGTIDEAGLARTLQRQQQA